jgi:hypothetical protein
MMSTQKVAEDFVAAWQAGDADTLTALAADGFTFSGAVPEPLPLQPIIGLILTLKDAFPDIQYNAKIQRVEGNVVHLTPHLTGAHTGDLDLTAMGLGVIPATGKSINLPEETARITVEGDKVVNYHVDPIPGGGLPGILAQLGIAAPQG